MQTGCLTIGCVFRQTQVDVLSHKLWLRCSCISVTRTGCRMACDPGSQSADDTEHGSPADSCSEGAFNEPDCKCRLHPNKRIHHQANTTKQHKLKRSKANQTKPTDQTHAQRERERGRGSTSRWIVQGQQRIQVQRPRLFLL